MTATLDVFRHGNEFSILITGVGMGTAPVVINRTSGASTACRPTRTEGVAGLAMRWGLDNGPPRRPGPRDNAWTGTLPIGRSALEAQLSLVVRGEVRHLTARWPSAT